MMMLCWLQDKHRAELTLMLETGKRAEIEALYSHGFDFLGKYVARKIVQGDYIWQCIAACLMVSLVLLRTEILSWFHQPWPCPVFFKNDLYLWRMLLLLLHVPCVSMLYAEYLKLLHHLKVKEKSEPWHTQKDTAIHPQNVSSKLLSCGLLDVNCSLAVAYISSFLPPLLNKDQTVFSVLTHGILSDLLQF